MPIQRHNHPVAHRLYKIFVLNSKYLSDGWIWVLVRKLRDIVMPQINGWRKVIGFLILLFSFALLFLIIVMCWILRDGLGPDSVTSHGMEALQRFILGCWPTVLIPSILGLVGFWLIHPIFSSQKISSKAPIRK